MLKNLSTVKYFIQEQERSLTELFDMQDGFDSLDEAKEWIAEDDPKKKRAYDVYLVDVIKVHSV